MTATEKEPVETSLNEVRMLVLGTQILLGFQYRASFEPGFPSLPGTAQYFQVTALVLLVANMTCMIAPAPYHRFVSRGHATARAERYTKRMALLALVPFALALGIFRRRPCAPDRPARRLRHRGGGGRSRPAMLVRSRPGTAPERRPQGGRDGFD